MRTRLLLPAMKAETAAEDEETVAASSSDLTPVSGSDSRLESATGATSGTPSVVCERDKGHRLEIECNMSWLLNNIL